MAVKTDLSVFIIWLIFVIIWNFGYPSVPPIFDVIAAVLLSFFSLFIKKLINKLI